MTINTDQGSDKILFSALTGRSFQFGRVDGSTIGQIILASEGNVVGYQNPNERYWSISDGTLIFRDLNGVPTTIFDQVHCDNDVYTFRGEFLPRGEGVWHTLDETSKLRSNNIIGELSREVYGGDLPIAYAQERYEDEGYPHTNLIPEVIATVLDTVRPTFWLEIGSMLGGSAIRVADSIKEKGTSTEIVCIDPFTGDVNMWAWEQQDRVAARWQFIRLEHGRPTIYDRFLANVSAAGHGDIILPIATTSIVGIKLLRRLISEARISSLPSVIYLDSAHEPDETFLELQNCWEILEPGGVLMGDDWEWDAVRHDVLRFAETIHINNERSQTLVARHQSFSNQGGVLLDRGQWVIVK